MDYSWVSKEQFDERGIDTDAARTLADLLQDEVEREVHIALRPIVERVVERLNIEGHNLTPYEIKPGELSYKDESSEGKTQPSLGCDVVISSGYALMSAGRENLKRL
jgi:hypothetical protein